MKKYKDLDKHEVFALKLMEWDREDEMLHNEEIEYQEALNEALHSIMKGHYTVCN